jgi:hypothetical protein
MIELEAVLGDHLAAPRETGELGWPKGHWGRGSVVTVVAFDRRDGELRAIFYDHLGNFGELAVGELTVQRRPKR